MKFVVSNTANSMEPNFAKTVGLLETELPLIFARTQPPQPLSGGKTFVKTLNEDKDEHGRLRQLLGVVPLPAVQTFLDVPTEVAIKGEVQTWDIYNTTADTHPMHFHLVNVEVLKRRQWAFNPDGTPKFPLTPIGPDLPIDDNERGWRETVRMNPGEVTTVAMKFDLPTGTAPKNSPRLLASYGIKGAEYVWHCHILEHEEHDMMHALVVV
jgi:spore coat protein A